MHKPWSNCRRFHQKKYVLPFGILARSYAFIYMTGCHGMHFQVFPRGDKGWKYRHSRYNTYIVGWWILVCVNYNAWVATIPRFSFGHLGSIDAMWRLSNTCCSPWLQNTDVLMMCANGAVHPSWSLVKKDPKSVLFFRLLLDDLMAQGWKLSLHHSKSTTFF